jgi:hypothetical protein
LSLRERLAGVFRGCFGEQIGDFLQILYKCLALLFASIPVGSAKDGRGMRCRHDVRSEFAGNQFSPVSGYPKILSEKGLSRTRPKAYQNLWLHHLKLSVEPWAAGLNLGMSRLLMDTSLTTLGRHPFEMLDHVGNINRRAIDSHFNQNLIEQLSRGANEGVTLAVFLVSRLLAHKHDQRLRRPFPENRLRRVFPKITASTSCRRFLQGHDAEPRRQIGGGRCTGSNLGSTLTPRGRLADRLGLSANVRPRLPGSWLPARVNQLAAGEADKYGGLACRDTDSVPSAFGNSS